MRSATVHHETTVNEAASTSETNPPATVCGCVEQVVALRLPARSAASLRQTRTSRRATAARSDPHVRMWMAAGVTHSHCHRQDCARHRYSFSCRCQRTFTYRRQAPDASTPHTSTMLAAEYVVRRRRRGLHTASARADAGHACRPRQAAKSTTPSPARGRLGERQSAAPRSPTQLLTGTATTGVQHTRRQLPTAPTALPRPAQRNGPPWPRGPRRTLRGARRGPPPTVRWPS